MINPMLKRALQYVKNTNGGAEIEHFFDDHEPVGAMLWEDLLDKRLVVTDEYGKIFVTIAGEDVLADKDRKENIMLDMQKVREGELTLKEVQRKYRES